MNHRTAVVLVRAFLVFDYRHSITIQDGGLCDTKPHSLPDNLLGAHRRFRDEQTRYTVGYTPVTGRRAGWQSPSDVSQFLLLEEVDPAALASTEASKVCACSPHAKRECDTYGRALRCDVPERAVLR